METVGGLSIGDKCSVEVRGVEMRKPTKGHIVRSSQSGNTGLFESQPEGRHM